MSSQAQSDAPGSLSLADHFIYLMRDKTVRLYPKTVEFYMNMGADPALPGGRLLSFYQVSRPEDVHYPVWEMHPEGDEVLVLASGSLTVELREPTGTRMVPLPSNAAVIVPAGIWHRLVVNEPSTLIAITPCLNTELEEA